jgi:hypothetical protein
MFSQRLLYQSHHQRVSVIDHMLSIWKLSNYQVILGKYLNCSDMRLHGKRGKHIYQMLSRLRCYWVGSPSRRRIRRIRQVNM